MINYRSRLHNAIPGGAHTYSRGDDQFPSNAPAILDRGEGAYVYTPEGNAFLDYGMGLRSVNIGYGNQEVAQACYEQILKGNNLTRASVIELEAAERLISLVPSVDMIKFAKHGSSVTTAAVKLARAYTGKKYVAIPAEQPFFSFDDWFIGSTVMSKGVPEDISQYTLRFSYNNIESLEKLFDAYPGQIAAVMLEPATTVAPKVLEGGNETGDRNFLHAVKDVAHKNGAVFILDEMITGFRWRIGGAQTFFNIQPDLCTFGKAMANGFALAALCGKKEIMRLGSILDEGQERVFLTSTTHGAEMGAIGAFLKTVEIIERENVIDHVWSYGKQLVAGVNQIATELGVQNEFFMEGYPCSPNYVTKDKTGTVSLAFRTLFSQEMIKNGVIMPYVALSFSHKEKELAKTISAVENTLQVYKKALDGNINEYLQSPVIKPVFRKHN